MDSPRAVFLSYASQDADAARRIADALRAAGIEVWFDQSELRGGDAWDGKIRKQIKDCALFMPVVSANTQARGEGYFRLEWHLAEQRSHLIARGRPFIVPVAIDQIRDTDALVPDAFLAVQWTRLPGGEVSNAFVERIGALLRDGGAGAGPGPDTTPTRKTSAHETPPAPERGRRWRLVVVSAAVAVVIAFGVVTFLMRRAPPTPPVTNTAPLSEARQLVERARAIMAKGSLTRAQLDAANELCERALQLDSTDAIIWSEAARADLLLIHPYGYDRSDERRKRAQSRATRALNLAPDLFEVRVIHAAVLAHAGGSPALLHEAEATFRELIASHPDDRDLVIQLAEVLREQMRFEEAAALFESVGEFEVAGWSYFLGGKPRAALAAVERALREKRAVSALQLKAVLQANVDEDLAAAQATMDQIRPSELLAEMPAAIAARIAWLRRDPERVLQILNALPADYLNSNAYRGPRQFYTGLADEIAGRSGAAEAGWRAGLALVQERLKSAPDDRELLLWAAWLQASLGDTAEAERLLQRAQKVAGLDRDAVNTENVKVFLRLGRNEAVLSWLTAFLTAKAPEWEFVHADARFDPRYDGLRDDPRFEKLLRDNLPEGAKPFDTRPVN